MYKTKHFKESEVIRDLAYSVRVDRHCERLSTSLLPVGLQHSKALCQTHGKSLEVLKSEPTNTEHRGEETCPGSECRLEGQLAQMPLALYVLIACTVRQDCLRALTYCVHFWPGCCRLKFAFYQHHASLWYPSKGFFLSLLLSPAAHSLGQTAKNGKFFFAASSAELGKKLNSSWPLSCPHF